jgi:hypothetical protein
MPLTSPPAWPVILKDLIIFPKLFSMETPGKISFS